MATNLPRKAPERGAALALVSVWVCLVGGALLDVPIWLTFSACCLASLIARPQLALRDVWLGLVGLSLSAALFGCLLQLIWLVGLLLDLAPGRAPQPADDVTTWIAVGGLAPFFEEITYRGRLLDALRASWGTSAAVLGTTAAFAVIHGTAWSILACSIVGLALAVLRLRTQSLGLTIGAHAGINLSALISLELPEWAGAITSPAWGLAALPLLAAAARKSRCQQRVIA